MGEGWIVRDCCSMNRVLQLFFFVVAISLVFADPGTVKAQNYPYTNSPYAFYDPAPPRYRSRARVRKTSRPDRAKAARIARLRRKARQARRAKRNRARRASIRRKLKQRKSRSSARRALRGAGAVAGSKGEGAAGLATAGKGPVQIVVSLPRQKVTIYRGGKQIASARVSTGKNGHRTPPGVFSIIQKNRTHFSNIYDNAPMPFMQRITWSGLALHAGNVSRPYASHGCIRMPYGFAKKLFRRTRMGAHVIVASAPAAPQSISHDNLIQPAPKSAVLAGKNVQMAAYSDASKADDVSPRQMIAKLPGFIPPVAAARKRLGEQEELLRQSEAQKSVLEAAQATAVQDLDKRQAALKDARKKAVQARKALRRPALLVRSIKKRRAAAKRALVKAERRAQWAWKVVEKRRDNPKFEGNWMKQAVARATLRDKLVAEARTALDEVTARLDDATREHDAARSESRKAAELVVMRSKELRAARAALAEAGRAVLANRRAIAKAARDVKKARAGVKKAMAREKLPLRILVSPRLGRERVKDVQKLLTELGYEPGPVDGAIGSRTRTAIRAFQKELGEKQSGRVTDALVSALYERAGRAPVKNAHIYVRQGFVDLFDAPVEISDIAKPLGTHVFTAMHFDKGATKVDWTALTIKNSTAGRGKTRGRKGKKRAAKAEQVQEVTASEALDRVKIPDPVRKQLAALLTPGSSLVISDKGMSHETGKGTDFVVLTK